MILTPSSIIQQFQQLQECVARCEHDLAAIKSPRDEYEENHASVNGHLKRAWQRLYANQSSIDRQNIEGDIVAHTGELKQLEMRYATGLESAEINYKHRIESAWESFCGQVVAAFGIPLVKKSLLALDVPSQQVSDNPPTAQSESTPRATSHESATAMRDMRNASGHKNGIGVSSQYMSQWSHG